MRNSVAGRCKHLTTKCMSRSTSVSLCLLFSQSHSTTERQWVLSLMMHKNKMLCFFFPLKPTRCTLLLSIFISTSVHASGNYVPIIRRTYCIYATLVFFVPCRWVSGLQTRKSPPSSFINQHTICICWLVKEESYVRSMKLIIRGVRGTRYLKNGEYFVTKSFMACNPRQILIG